jgi:hypothetical protein
VADHSRIEWAGQERGCACTGKAADQGLQHHEHDRDRDERAPAVAYFTQEAGCHQKAIA